MSKCGIKSPDFSAQKLSSCMGFHLFVLEASNLLAWFPAFRNVRDYGSLAKNLVLLTRDPDLEALRCLRKRPNILNPKARVGFS